MIQADKSHVGRARRTSDVAPKPLGQAGGPPNPEKLQDIMRFEPGFVASKLKPPVKARTRRTMAQMILSFPDELSRADYALDRIRKAEGTINEILHAIGPEAANIVFKQRPSLKQYW